MFESILNFLELGGEILWLLFFTTFFLWFFIFERFTFFYFSLPELKQQVQEEWKQHATNKTWFTNKIRQQLLSELYQNLAKHINIIKTLVVLCPLLGLLGTVTGMITVFDVMAITGTGNARMMASGISMATIPTMAGMVTALSGLYFGNFLQNKVKKEWNSISAELNYN